MSYIASPQARTMPREAPWPTSKQSVRATRAGCSVAWREMVRNDLPQAREMGQSPIRLLCAAPFGVLLVPKPSSFLPELAQAPARPRRGRHPSENFGHLAGRRRPPGLGGDDFDEARDAQLRSILRPLGATIAFAGNAGPAIYHERDHARHPSASPPRPQSRRNRSC